MTSAAAGSPPAPVQDQRGGRPWLPGGVMVVVGAMTPVLAYLGNLGFAPLVGLAGLACIPFAVARRRPSLGIGLLLALLVWALISLSWSPAAPRAFGRYRDLEQFTGLKLILQLALYGAFVLAARRVAAPTARLTLLVVGCGLALAMSVVVLEALRGAPLYQALKAMAHQYTRPDLARRNVARAAYAAVLLIWPAGLALVERGWSLLTFALLLETAAAALLLNVDAPLLALAVGAACFLAVRRGARFGAWALAAAAVIYFATAPMIFMLGEHALPKASATELGKASWGARVEVWRFVVARIAEHPLRGLGLDASRVFPHVVPLHPHDAALQIWLELGAPGAVLAACFFGWLAVRVAALRRVDANLAACAAASLGAYLTVGALSFGVWQEWWLALGALSLAAVELAACARRGRSSAPLDALEPLAFEPSRVATSGIR